MKHTRLILPLLLIFFFTSTTHALVQFRGHYGIGQPKGVNNIEPDLQALGADVIVSLPLFPLVFGLRYENITGDEDVVGGKYEVDLTRVSGLVGYRLIDTLIYIGLLGSFGLVHDGETKAPSGNVDIEMDFSATASLEAGVKLTGFIIGAELGYMMGEDDARNASNTFEYNGVIAKIHLGYEF